MARLKAFKLPQINLDMTPAFRPDEEDPELAEMERQLYELEKKSTNQKVRAKKKAQTERKIAKLQQEIAEHQTILQLTAFTD
ncbi:MAG TPA: hypothetical protein EYP98_07950, partial [Planctomycetes bacterium]|nr:hypothetical protein [Planctomycetota bacterium]